MQSLVSAVTDVVVVAQGDVVAAVVVIAGERVVVLHTTKTMTTLNCQVAVGSKEQRSSLTTPSHDSIRNNSSSDTSPWSGILFNSGKDQQSSGSPVIPLHSVTFITFRTTKIQFLT